MKTKRLMVLFTVFVLMLTAFTVSAEESGINTDVTTVEEGSAPATKDDKVDVPSHKPKDNHSDDKTEVVPDKDNNALTKDQLINNPDYEFVTFLAGEPIVDENNVISFKNITEYKNGYVDTNTYVIDDKSVIFDSPEGIADIEWFIDGRARWITVIIPTEKENAENEIIHADGVWGFSANVVGYNEVVTDSVQGEFIKPEKREYETEADFQRLIDYKIMQGNEKGELGLDNFVTRAEMAQFIINAKCLTGISGTGDTFSDVDINHWAYNAVMLARSLNIVDGVGENLFEPDETVTQEQAVKMIVCALGYNYVALQRGGYPDGYISIAEELGLTQNMQIQPDYLAKRRDIAVMMDTALDIPLLDQTVYGSEPRFAVLNGQNGVEEVTWKNDLDILKNKEAE